MEFLSLVVDALALEEDDRVGSLQCAVHQSLGIVWSYREHNLESRYVGAERSPVLRVLGAVLASY